MPQFREIQREFGAAVRDAKRAVPDALTSYTRRHPLRRFNVHRNNFYVGLVDVLAGRFPVVARLVGEEFFRAMARVYVEANPPRSPMLIEYGADFAPFLEAFEPVQDVPYLADIARLEWAWHLAYYAADAAPLAAEDLARVAPEQVGALSLDLHPSLGLVHSCFPVVAIWETNTVDEHVRPVDLASGGEDALIVRPQLQIEVRRLPAGAHAFISALVAGKSLAEANDAAIVSDAAFDLPVNIAGLIRAGAIIGYRSTDAV